MCIVKPAFMAQRAPELLDQTGGEIRADDRLRHSRLVKMEKRPAGNIDDDARQRLVERGVGVAVAGDAVAVAERLADA